ncbi:MAG: cytochrome P450 [Caulobacteraceae bacterium]|nr:cytochrome P450 [Caulobacteraceae bacterium]
MDVTDQENLPRGIELTSLSAEFRADPHGVLGRARAQCPVIHDGVLRDYVVLSAELGRKILADRALPTDPRQTAPSSTRRLRGEDLTKAPPLLFADDPDHRRVRGLMRQAFNQERIELVRARVARICHDLIDRIDGEAFDFIEAIARPLPTITIAEMLGVDPAQHENFKLWSDEMVAASLNPLASPQAKAAGAAAAISLNALFAAEIARRQAAGVDGEDLLSQIMRAEDGGDRLSPEEISEQAQLLLIAGNQTTTDLMGTMLRNILSTSGCWDRLVANPDLIPNAVDEAIRFEPPIFTTERIAPEDMDLAGLTVPKGYCIAVMLPSVNHDPALNPAPETFDIERQNIRHFSFGGGRHTCLGAPLARLEGQELLRALTGRMPRLRQADGEAAIVSMSPGFRGLDHLHLIRG